MKYKITDINGKHYLELPCKPDTIVYQVHKKFRVQPPGVKINRFESEWVITQLCLRTVHDILYYYDDFGDSIFINKDDATKELNRRKEKMEE